MTDTPDRDGVDALAGGGLVHQPPNQHRTHLHVRLVPGEYIVNASEAERLRSVYDEVFNRPPEP